MGRRLSSIRPRRTAGRGRQQDADVAVDSPAEGRDPDGLSVIQVQDPDAFQEGIRTFTVPAEGTRTVSVRWMTGVAPDQVCPQIRQIDGLGVATEWSERVCADVDPGEAAMCGTTSGASLGALVLAGLLGLVRRRAG